MHARRMLLLLCSLAIVTGAHAQNNLPSQAEMWKIIQQQSKQIETMQKQIDQLTGKVDTTDERLEAVADAVDDGGIDKARSKTHIGGYGELHYNNLEGKNGKADKDEVDFHRFVVMLNHDFNDRIRLFTEVELEHALVGDTDENDGTGATDTTPGEVELEQAYIEMDLDDEGRHRSKAGIFLIPVGFLNETHEPPTFYGVERNNVEKNIIPTTWWEGGLAFNGQITDEISYDVAYTSGLEVATVGGNAYKIRNGRKKVASAPGSDGAWTGRVRYKTAGFELGTTLQYQEDLTQGAEVGDADATLFEAHAAYEYGNFALKALYARWDLDAAGAEAIGRDEQTGWYIEPSYKINDHFGIFVRYSEWDNNAGDSADTEVEQWDFGISWWPHEDVVIKLDYQDQDAAGGHEDGINLGVGYQF